MGDSPDCDYLFLVRIDDNKWKSPQQESAGLVASKRAAFWRCRAIEFLDEVQGNFRISVFIPNEGTSYVCGCSLVIYDAASTHSVWREAEAAALPRGR